MKKYFEITENDAYVKLFNEIITELDVEFFNLQYYNQYKQFSNNCKHLIVRMYLRQDKWISLTELSKYLPIQTLKQEVIPQLCRTDWLDANPTLADLVKDLATMPQIQKIYKELGTPIKSKNKQELISHLTQLAKQQLYFKSDKVVKILQENVDSESYKLQLSKRQFLLKLETMFLFPMGPQSRLEDALLCLMNQHQYVEYEYYTQKERPLFESKEEFEEFFSTKQVCDKIYSAYELGNTEFLKTFDLSSHTSKRPQFDKSKYIWGRSVYNLSQLLMKNHDFETEYKLLQLYIEEGKPHKSKLGQALIRKLLLETRFLTQSQTKGMTSWLLGMVNTFYDALEAVNPIERRDLDRKSVKFKAAIRKTEMNSVLGIVTQTQTIKSQFKVPEIVINADTLTTTTTTTNRKRLVYADGLNVEKTAINQVYMDYDRGGHYETSFILTIFWLINLDILFGDKNEFRCRYQSGPMHLKSVLTENLSEILKRAHSPLKFLKYSETPVVMSVNWKIPIEDLRIGAEYLSGSKLEAIFKNLCLNYFEFNSGFPDLTLINTKTKQIKFVEVKSENDKVSDSQHIWMEFLGSQGIDVEICKVVSREKLASLQKRRRVSPNANVRVSNDDVSPSKGSPNKDNTDNDDGNTSTGQHR